MSERGIFMDITDVIVIGAGPAGLNAALYASRKELSVKIISNDIGGQMLLTSEIENYLGFESISGFDLADKMEAHVRKYPVEFITAAVMNLEKNEDGNFVLHLDDGNTVVGKGLHYYSRKAQPHAGYTGRSQIYRPRRILLCHL